jgi:Flp pilus assembly protein TadD
MIGIVLLAGGVLGQTNNPSLSSDLLRQAYLSVVDAELARAENKTVEAVKAYRKALEFYGRLQTEYPGWQGDAVGYRVADCQNALAKLDPVKTPDDKPSADLVSDDTNTVLRLAQLVKELKRVREALAFSPEAPSADSAQVVLSRELDRVRAERDQAERANQVLQRKMARGEVKATAGTALESTNLTGKTVSGTIRNEARRLMESGDNQAALLLLKEARVTLPEDTDLTILTGVAACRAGRFGEALTVLKPFDTKGATQAGALLTLGTAYMGLGQIGEARVATEKALKIDPRSPEANYNMAQILLAVSPSEPDAAQQYYRQAVALGLPADAELENSLRMATILSRLKSRKK